MAAWRRAFIRNQNKNDEKQVEHLTKDQKLEHHILHNNLKMTNGLMSQVKAVLNVYSEMTKKGMADDELSLPKMHWGATGRQ